MTSDVKPKAGRTTQNHVGCFTLYTVLGDRAKPIQKEIEHFQDTNGVEWTCNRMKSIWTAANHLRNGDRSSAIAAYQKASISYRKDTCLPKGEISYLVNQYVRARKPSRIRKYAACLRFYTGLYVDSRKATHAQSLKSVKSICGRSTAYADTNDELQLLTAFRKRLHCLPKAVAKEIAEASPKGNLHSDSYYFHTVNLLREDRKELSSKPYGLLMLSLMTESWVPASLEAQHSSVKADTARQCQLYEYGIDSGYAGRILAMQQNGCKARVVAQPTAALQRAFLPLHGALDLAISALYPGESCLKAQAQGAEVVADHLARGNKAFSIDLSSATDRFPRSLTKKILNELGLKRYADALEEVCNRPWHNANMEGPEKLYYEVGQPMGLYGSFPMFHLSNLVVADEAVRKAQQTVKWSEGRKELTPFADGTFFKVVGDDIVLSDLEVAYHYERDMLRLGVDISVNKSFRGHVAEFAGFIATEASHGYECFRPYKVPLKEWVSNPMDCVHALGKPVSRRSEHWERVFDAYQKTFQSRNIDLTPSIKTEDPILTHTVGKEPWISSLTLDVENYIRRAKDSSRTALCCLDWLNERSGYNFANQTFEEYANSTVSTGHSRERIGDYRFTPEVQLKLDKQDKQSQMIAANQNFWKDPLNDQVMYEERPEERRIMHVEKGHLIKEIGPERSQHDAGRVKDLRQAFWDNPRNAKWKDIILRDETLGVKFSFAERAEWATVKSEFIALNSPGKTKSINLDLDRS